MDAILLAVVFFPVNMFLRLNQPLLTICVLLCLPVLIPYYIVVVVVCVILLILAICAELLRRAYSEDENESRK